MYIYFLELKMIPMKYIVSTAIMFMILNHCFSQSMNLEWVTVINTNNSQVTGSHLREDNKLLLRGFYQDYIEINGDTVISESDEIQDSYLL